MKTFLISIAVLLICVSSAGAADDCCSIFPKVEKRVCGLDEYGYEIHNGNIILYPNHGKYEKIKITDDDRLFVDGREYELTSDDKELTKNIRGLAKEIDDEACEIGREGAKIGMAGAKLGVVALASVIRLISPDYDSRDLERDMEKKSAKLEAKAEKLEEKADKLEEKASELKKLVIKLEDRIPELKEKDRT